MDEVSSNNIQDTTQRDMQDIMKEKEKIMNEINSKDIQDAMKMREVEARKMAHKINDVGMESVLKDTLLKLREAKPIKRGERSRRYAIVITEMEKVYAYFKTFVVDDSKLQK